MIYIDSHEKPYVFQAFDSAGIQYQKKELQYGGEQVGDFTDDKTWIAERKTADDFVSSVMSNRMIMQSVKLTSLFPGHRFLILKGNLTSAIMKTKPLNKNYIESVLVEVAATYHITVIPSDSVNHTARIVKQLDKFVNKLPDPAPMMVWMDKDPRISLLGNIPGIGEKKALALLNHFGSIAKIVSASLAEIMEVDGIGPKLGAKVYGIWHLEMADKKDMYHDPRSGKYYNRKMEVIASG